MKIEWGGELKTITRSNRATKGIPFPVWCVWSPSFKNIKIFRWK